MKRTQHHNIGDRVIDRAPFIVFVWATLVLALGMYRGQSSISLYLSLKDSEIVLSKAVGNLKSENRKLEDEIFKLKKSKDYARKVLRDRYHITEGDEKIIYFAD